MNERAIAVAITGQADTGVNTSGIYCGRDWFESQLRHCYFGWVIRGFPWPLQENPRKVFQMKPPPLAYTPFPILYAVSHPVIRCYNLEL
jgi:hypothetical protein